MCDYVCATETVCDCVTVTFVTECVTVCATVCVTETVYD